MFWYGVYLRDPENGHAELGIDMLICAFYVLINSQYANNTHDIFKYIIYNVYNNIHNPSEIILIFLKVEKSCAAYLSTIYLSIYLLWKL